MDVGRGSRPGGPGFASSNPGLLTTVQDLGDGGCRRAACRWRARWIRLASPRERARGQRLAAAATLEVTLLGPELEFEDDRSVAIAGAAFEIRIDDHGRRSDGRAS